MGNKQKRLEYSTSESGAPNDQTRKALNSRTEEGNLNTPNPKPERTLSPKDLEAPGPKSQTSQTLNLKAKNLQDTRRPKA